MTNTYYNIPQLINHHIMLFYEEFKWYKQNHGQGLEFISDTEVKLTTGGDSSGIIWPTSLFENLV